MPKKNLLRDVEIGKVFTPASPVSYADLFAGRTEQLRRVTDTVSQRGQHAVIFGERGVGKTSLANIVSILLAPGESFYAPRINCDSNDLYLDLWKKAFGSLGRSIPKSAKSQSSEFAQQIAKAQEEVKGYATPGEICSLLDDLSASAGLVFIFDECDRLVHSEARTALADTIKTLSDQDIDATLILVGVSDSVDGLIDEHRSLERALVQVQMPRMEVAELKEILEKGTAKLGMTIDSKAKNHIAVLSRGLPHYTHLIARHAARGANSKNRSNITEADVWRAVEESLQDVSASIRSDYIEAVSSAHKGTLYRHVLAACALASSNDLGWFSATSVRAPLEKITGKAYEIGGFARHIGAFCESDRGEVLQRAGKKHNFRYRFTNPLMQPYAILRAVSDHIIEGSIEELLIP